MPKPPLRKPTSTPNNVKIGSEAVRPSSSRSDTRGGSDVAGGQPRRDVSPSSLTKYVSTATAIDVPANRYNSGTIKNQPPTPNKPGNNPVTKPMPTTMTISPRLTASPALRLRPRRPFARTWRRAAAVVAHATHERESEP